jgi:hypothetical protein
VSADHRRRHLQKERNIEKLKADTKKMELRIRSLRTIYRRLEGLEDEFHISP